MADRPLESWEQHSVLDGLDHFTGIFALLVTAMIGVDIYLWLALGKPPKFSMFWMPPIALRMWRRAITGENAWSIPRSWYAWMAVYGGVILAVVLFRGIRTMDDRWMAGFGAVWVAISIWRATRRDAGR